MRLIFFISKERIIKMDTFQFNQMMEQDKMSAAATKPAKGPAEGEVWLNVDGDIVTIGDECCDFKSGSDFLYAEFQSYAKTSPRPFEDLAFDLDMEADDLFEMLLEGADEDDIMDVLIDAYDGQRG